MNENIVNDQGTTQSQVRQMLEKLNENGFDGNVENLALVLGRTEDEIARMLDGSENIDDDLAMKIRGIAAERHIEID